ncbi:hypothetical protein K474DRAFT_1699619 [Panus rudis PR-1116 ss-1]|nr:hypothetical protein K474DRAFT_1699619 [Panus rudis PR-1116 ss-1]
MSSTRSSNSVSSIETQASRDQLSSSSKALFQRSTEREQGIATGSSASKAKTKRNNAETRPGSKAKKTEMSLPASRRDYKENVQRRVAKEEEEAQRLLWLQTSLRGGYSPSTSGVNGFLC